MRCSSRYALLAATLLGFGCQSNTAVLSSLPPPQRLAYQLDPSGDLNHPDRPVGILLVWDDVTGSNLASYRVYSRGSTSGNFDLRAETSSNTFHDNGVPYLQYYVTAVDVDGGESDPSNLITVDERLQLAKPENLFSVSLNGAVELDWTDNAFLTDPDRFKWYRVYSMPYDLDLGMCVAQLDSIYLEGTTVAPEFLVGALRNGVPRCYGISAISDEGYESMWSPLRQDTPRPDARNVLVYAFESQPAQSGFRFWNDLNGNGRGDPGELGLVQDGNRTDIDFWIHRQASDSTLWIVPEFGGDSMRLYDSASPVADLTSIDFAPETGYSRNMFQAAPGYGYVFQRLENGQYHYAGLRVTHVGRQYVIFDFSVQTDPGNPELVVMRPESVGSQAP